MRESQFYHYASEFISDFDYKLINVILKAIFYLIKMDKIISKVN
jgi:hypothetical protein